MGILTIGDIARTEPEILQGSLGKMGLVLWLFANGKDDSTVKVKGESASVKSVGNSMTTPRDLETNEEVKIIMYVLSESVAARLRENGFRCRTIEISVRDNGLYSFTRQIKLRNVTNITTEIAETGYRLFLKNYNWEHPIRSVGIRGADLVTDIYCEQMDLFCDYRYRDKQMKADQTVDDIRRRFGFYSVKSGLMVKDEGLSGVNAKEDHTVHPKGYFT